MIRILAAIDWNAVIAGIGTLISGGLLHAGGQFWIKKFRATREENRTDGAQVFKHQSDVIATLLLRIDSLEMTIRQKDEDRAKEQDEYAATMRQLGQLEAIAEEQRNRLKYLEGLTDPNSTREAIVAAAKVQRVVAETKAILGGIEEKAKKKEKA